jgi:hypothetical protein
MIVMFDLLIHDQLFRPAIGRDPVAEHRSRALAERRQRVRAGRRFGRRVRPSLRPKAA